MKIVSRLDVFSVFFFNFCEFSFELVICAGIKL